jgi:hypothetical protein
MEKLHFSLEEVISFLEMKMIDNTATYEQEQLYVDYKWDGKLKKNYTYKLTLRQMKKIYENGF